jgi:YegS/Rv2252/BmrU family lipid kinase
METKPLPKDAVLIVNAQSRRGQDYFAQARDKLDAAGIRLIAAHAVEDPEKMAATVADAVASGAPMAIVGGGDGSLSGTVDELVGKDCVFGVLPLGTANSFARTLGLPLDLDGAVQAIATGKRRRVDLGMVDRDYFVNAAALGLSPQIGQTVPHNLKRYLGRIGYLIWAVKCSVGFRAFRLTVGDGQTERRMWSTEVRILNGSYLGGVELSDDADVDTGEIVVQAVVGRSKLHLAWDWYAKFFKLRDRDAHTEEFYGRSFRIDSVPRQHIAIDGEVLAKTPVTVRIAPGAVEVAAPADRDDQAP